MGIGKEPACLRRSRQFFHSNIALLKQPSPCRLGIGQGGNQFGSKLVIEQRAFRLFDARFSQQHGLLFPAQRARIGQTPAGVPEARPFLVAQIDLAAIRAVVKRAAISAAKVKINGGFELATDVPVGIPLECRHQAGIDYMKFIKNSPYIQGQLPSALFQVGEELSGAES